VLQLLTQCHWFYGCKEWLLAGKMLKYQITGSPCALKCCKAHAKINRKMGNSTPCKILTCKNLNIKIGRHDYVGDIAHRANFGWIRFSGGFSPNMWNITLLWLFDCPVFFSILHTGQTIGPIFTVHGSNDVFLRKDGPFGVWDNWWRHLGKICPQNPQNGGVNRQYPAKSQKSSNFDIIKTTQPI